MTALTLADEIEAALKGATEGPWQPMYYAWQPTEIVANLDDASDPVIATVGEPANKEHHRNAALIALLRNRAPEIVEMLRKMGEMQAAGGAMAAQLEWAEVFLQEIGVSIDDTT